MGDPKCYCLCMTVSDKRHRTNTDDKILYSPMWSPLNIAVFCCYTRNQYYADAAERNPTDQLPQHLPRGVTPPLAADYFHGFSSSRLAVLFTRMWAVKAFATNNRLQLVDIGQRGLRRVGRERGESRWLPYSPIHGTFFCDLNRGDCMAWSELALAVFLIISLWTWRTQ